MDSFALVIFGITSNLAQLKLIPALYDMAESGLLPENMVIVGSARSAMSERQFYEYIHKALHAENRHHQHPIKDATFQKLFKQMHYIDGNLDDAQFYQRLDALLNDQTKHGHSCDNRIFYLATYPDLYRTIFEHLKGSGLSDQKRGWVRLMIEKPIGSDYHSSRELNALLLKYFSEEQIYRIDHYLGKETLQNILTFRFGNGIFEPLMNHEHIDHIQVTASEDFGIGSRGGYYDAVGGLKDVGQNHLLQMISFATMDAPAEFTNTEITKERHKILRDLVPDPTQVVLGQYKGYKHEERVAADSRADTYFAFRTFLDNNRFKGVPIYVRGGKQLAQTATEVSIVFKSLHSPLFSHARSETEKNVLIFRIQPNEGIVLKILTKKPGANLQLIPDYMQFCYKYVAPELPDPYERLISDCLNGDQTFFNDAREVEAAWKFIDALRSDAQPLHAYEPGSWGPTEADQLLARDGREWLLPSMDFCRL